MSSFLSSIPILAQAAAPQPLAPTPWYQETWVNALLALVVLVGPFLVGAWLAKRWRMSEYATRFGLVLFALTAGAVICWRGWPPKLGIDLSGGVILVYEVDQSKATTVDAEGVVQDLRKAFQNTDITADVTATDGKIDVTLPTLNPAEIAKAEAVLAKISFHDAELALSRRHIVDGKQVLEYGVKKTGSIDMDRMVSAISKRVNPGGQKEVAIRRMGADRVEVIIPEVDQAEVDVIKEKISTAGALKFRILANPRAPIHTADIELAKEASDSEVKRKDSDGNDIVIAQWLPLDPQKFENPEADPNMVVRKNKKGETEVLIIPTAYDVGGQYLARAVPANDRFGRPSVNFQFNSQGSLLFGDLTSSHLPDKNTGLEYRLGIMLDDVLKSAPTIQDTITSNGEITGNFTEAEVQFLVDILNAGSLPAALSKVPIAEYTSSAQLGSDTIRAGAYSMFMATSAVMIFMFVYYRFAGLVADLAVLLNVLLVLAVLILIKAHLTLAGLAGMVLSIGMAVDANVLIYERIREELERGAAMRMAIRNGFARALTTIIDSNLTTLIIGVVLFAIGSDQLRGFATTLILGLTLNLFTAVYCSRVIFDVAERRRWITQLKMLKWFGKTNFDFVGWMKPATALSVLFITIGLAAGVARENGLFGSAGLFGIDFTGGSAVQVVFKEPTDIAEVRRTVAVLPDVSVSAVASGERVQSDTRFNINTSDPDINGVEAKLNELFPQRLKTYSVDVVSAGSQADQPQESPASTTTEATPRETASADSKGAGPQAPSDVAKGAAADSADQRVTDLKLRFPEGINHDALQATLERARASVQLPNAHFELTSPDPEYTPGGSRPVADWEVKVYLPKEQTQALLTSLQQQLADTPVFPTSNSIGGKVAGDTKVAALYALVVSNLLIVLYVWVRFQNVAFGLAAVAALVHDVLITIGALSLSYWLAGPLGFLQVDPFKITLEVVAALLTIVGFSINDTIVIFDRIREVRGKSPDISPSMINIALNQTLSRTFLTSGTVFLVTLILYAFGGEGIHAFAFTFLIGLIAGTYSSLFIAAPLLLWLRRPAASGNIRTSPALDAVGASGRA